MLKCEIIDKGTEIFKGKYDYSLIGDIKTKKEKFPIICPKHGVFNKTFEHHIRRQQGCPECSGRKRYTTEEFINKCQKLEHTSEMTFENTLYVNNKQKVKVYCHHKDNNGNDHGEFEISPGHLLSGEGCPKCRYVKSASSKRRSIEEIINKSKEIHGDKYDYSLLTEYKNDRVSYPIICPEHGVFYQTFNNHIKTKQGCPICGKIKCSEARILTTEEFINKAKEKHGDKYDYSKTVYKKSGLKVDIICPEHGLFSQVARNHLFGQGCPKCFRDKSTIERELFDFVREILPQDILVEENNRTVLNGKEIDVYVPTHKVGFEMNGLIWHSERFDIEPDYHLNKTLNCLKHGIRLIHIFEDEWLFKKDICKHIIKNALNCYDKIIHQELCEVKEVGYNETISFLEENHLRGSIDNDLSLGAYYNDELVEIMSFKRNNQDYEILRHCYCNNISINKNDSLILKYFVENYNPNTISILIDKGYDDDLIYKNFGFKFDNEIEPDYYFVESKIRFNKNVCPVDMDENEFLETKGWYKIYDCGYSKYMWRNN